MAFSAVTDAKEDGSFAVIDGTLRTLVRSDVDIYSHASEACLDDAGRVVLLGQPEEFVDAILSATWDSVRVIASDLNGESNEFGQVAYYDSLEDVRAGIAIGTPAPIGVSEASGPGPGERLAIWSNPTAGCIRFRVMAPESPLPPEGEVLDVAGRLVRRLCGADREDRAD